MGKYVIPGELTTEQQKALDGYFNDPKRYFYGVGFESKVAEFKVVNDLRNSDPEKADLREKRLFEILRYKT